MNLEELKNRILDFRTNVQTFQELLRNSRSRALPKVARNHKEIAISRSKLNSEYGTLEKYIRQFGNYPSMRDGVNSVSYSAYFNAFSGDILQRVFPSLRAVVQDLEIITGRLSDLTEEQFEHAMTPRQAKEKQSTEIKVGTNIWQVTNPIWLIWKCLILVRNHKILGIVLAVLILLAIDYSLAWQNVNSIVDFVVNYFK